MNHRTIYEIRQAINHLENAYLTCDNSKDAEEIELIQRELDQLTKGRK